MKADALDGAGEADQDHHDNLIVCQLRAFARNFVLGFSQITPASADRPNDSSLREMTELLEPEHVEQVQEMLAHAEEEQEEIAQTASQSGPTLKNGSAHRAR